MTVKTEGLGQLNKLQEQFQRDDIRWALSLKEAAPPPGHKCPG
jgi:hypothetical protein